MSIAVRVGRSVLAALSLVDAPNADTSGSGCWLSRSWPADFAAWPPLPSISAWLCRGLLIDAPRLGRNPGHYRWIVWTILTPALGGLVCGLGLYYLAPAAAGSGIPQVKVAFALRSGYISLKETLRQVCAVRDSDRLGRFAGR